MVVKRSATPKLPLAGFLLVFGIRSALESPLDVFPDFAPPQVVIQTEAPGLSPIEVEQLVTLPIETAVNGVSRLDVLRSQSIQGLSVLTVIFQDGAVSAASFAAAPTPVNATVVNSGGPTTCGDGLSAGPNTTCAF